MNRRYRYVFGYCDYDGMPCRERAFEATRRLSDVKLSELAIEEAANDVGLIELSMDGEMLFDLARMGGPGKTAWEMRCGNGRRYIIAVPYKGGYERKG